MGVKGHLGNIILPSTCKTGGNRAKNWTMDLPNELHSATTTPTCPMAGAHNHMTWHKDTSAMRPKLSNSIWRYYFPVAETQWAVKRTAVSWDVEPCRLVRSSKMSVTVYHTTRSNIPEVSCRHSRRHKNLTSHRHDATIWRSEALRSVGFTK
jgi:hypothetical protein